MRVSTMTRRSWADEAVERIHLEELETEKLVAEERLRRAQAPEVWAELREWIKQSCEEFNQRVGLEMLAFELMPTNKARVRKLDREHKGPAIAL